MSVGPEATGRIARQRPEAGPWLSARLAAWWHRLTAPDPGLVRLRSALRTTFTVALTSGVLYGLAKLAAFPMRLLGMGIILSLYASIAIREPDPGRQRVTLLLSPLALGVPFALATVLLPLSPWANLLVVPFTFLAAGGQRFGPRAGTISMLAFMGCLLGLFYRLPVGQLPGQTIFLAIATVCAYAVRFVLFPDRPARTLRRVVRSFDQRGSRLLTEIGALLAGDGWNEGRQRALKRHLQRLTEVALLADQQLERLPPDRLAADRTWLRYHLFDLELATERVAEAAVHSPPLGSARDRVARQLATLAAAWRERDPDTVLGLSHRPEVRRPEPDCHGAGRLGVAIADLGTALAMRPPPPGTAGAEDEAEAPPEPEPSAPDGWRHDPIIRQAIQATIATALALGAGYLLSPDRWFWTVLTAYLILIGTRSRGETLSKGWQRFAGTLAGVAIGLAVATVVGGQLEVSLTLITLSVFVSQYVSRVSYGLMVFWITVVIALLYPIMGLPDAAFLTLRLEETAIGAAIGVLVAWVVLPTSTRERTADTARDVLRQLGRLLDACARRLAGQADHGDLAARTRALDQCFQALRAAADPLSGGLLATALRARAQHEGRVLAACGHYARSLAHLVREGRMADHLAAGPLAEAATLIRRNGETLADALDGQEPGPLRSPEPLLDRAEASLAREQEGEPRASADHDRREAALNALRHLDRALARLAADLDYRPPAPPGPQQPMASSKAATGAVQPKRPWPERVMRRIASWKRGSVEAQASSSSRHS